MNTVFHIAVGLGLGAAAALWHLGVTHLRAIRMTRLGPFGVLLLMPLGLIGPAAAVLTAVRVAPTVAWATPVGLFLARAFMLARLRIAA